MTLVVKCTKICASISKGLVSYSYNVHVMRNVVFLVKAIKAYIGGLQIQLHSLTSALD
jgi:hypothetical protein